MLRHEIRQKSDILAAFGTLGIRTRFMALSCESSFPDVKNSFTAATTSPIILQVEMKNSAEKPSGPLALFLGREKQTVLITSLEKGAVSSERDLQSKRSSEA